MAASYPSSVVALSTKNDGDTIFASHVDAVQDEIIAIENGLLTGIAHNLLPDANNTRDLGSVAKAWANVYAINLKVNGIALQAPLVQTTTLTGTQNDFVLTTPANILVLRCNNATDLTFTGFVAGTDGQILIVESIGAGNVFVKHQNAGSAAANRAINCATSGDTPGAAGVGMFMFVYDGSTARWRLVQHEQGAWITPTYAGGNYTASAGTWTVDSGDVLTQAYWLRGRTMTVSYVLTTTSVSATPASLNITNAAWGSFTAAKQMTIPNVNNDNAVGNAAGFATVTAAGTVIALAKINGSFAISVNATNFSGQISFEVQ